MPSTVVGLLLAAAATRVAAVKSGPEGRTMLSTFLALLLVAAAPLVDAVKSGDRAAAVAMIGRRVDVNAPEADGTTALHLAVHQNDLDLAERLIRAGAKVNAKN